MTRETSCVAAAHRLETAGPRVGRQVAREPRERAACGFVSKEISNHAGCGKRDGGSGDEAGFGNAVISRRHSEHERCSPIPRPLPASRDQPRVSHASRASPQNNVSSAAGARNTPNGTSGVSNGVEPSASSVCSRA